MRSPAERGAAAPAPPEATEHAETPPAPGRARRGLETTLRLLLLGATIALLLLALRGPSPDPPAAAGGADIEGALVRWSTAERPAEVRIHFAAPTDPRGRDWLAALARTGTAVRWSGAAPPAAALAAEPMSDPQRPVQLWIAAPPATVLILADDLGPLGETRSSGGGARLVLPHLHGVLRARLTESDVVPAGAGRAGSGTQASTMLRDTLRLRPLLLLAEAGWEAKFALAALEERGWEVHARLAIAPDTEVRQGPVELVLDTAVYAAAVVLDSTAARHAPALASYVEAGGGLLALGEAAALGAFAALLPARAAPMPAPGRPLADTPEAPRAALALAPLRELRNGAVALETRGDTVAAAAWRVGEGRVLQVGYRDTWRWRMAGQEADPVAAHRAWWAAMVAGVAHAPADDVPIPVDLEPAPLAALHQAIGAPADAVGAAPPALLSDPRLRPALLALVLAALVLEIASRRLRGAP